MRIPKGVLLCAGLLLLNALSAVRAEAQGGLWIELNLQKIYCVDESGPDWWGSDEIYIKVNNQTVYSAGNFDSGDTYQINKGPFWQFVPEEEIEDTKMYIQVWEADPGPDSLSIHTYLTWQVPTGTYTTFGHLDGGVYRLTYSVQRWSCPVNGAPCMRIP